MALLQVRNFPDDLYEELAAKAKRERRSITQQVIVDIRLGVRGDELAIRRRRDLLNKLMNEPRIITGDYPSPAELIREDRDR